MVAIAPTTEAISIVFVTWAPFAGPVVPEVYMIAMVSAEISSAGADSPSAPASLIAAMPGAIVKVTVVLLSTSTLIGESGCTSTYAAPESRS